MVQGEPQHVPYTTTQKWGGGVPGLKHKNHCLGGLYSPRAVPFKGWAGQYMTGRALAS